MNKSFSAFSGYISRVAGRSSTFIVACGLVFLWFTTGPIFSFSDTWQLVLNTATNIVTFLMVFIIQNTQNRDSEALQIKVDELIVVNKHAHKALLDLEELTQDQLNHIKARYEKLAREARAELAHEKMDAKIPKV